MIPNTMRIRVPCCLFIVPVFVSGLFLPVLIKADEPLPPPELATVYSRNKKFVARLDPRENLIVVSRVEPESKATELWRMKGWYRVAAISNDGQYLVTGYDGINLLKRDYRRDEVMLRFFKSGNLIREVGLDRLIAKLGNLQPTVSHYAWGNYLGFDEQGRYVVETVEGRRIAFDPATGNPAYQRNKNEQRPF